MPMHLRGCDIQVCFDGNFGHKRNVNAGDCPPITSYTPEFFVPSTFVDAVDDSLKAAGQRKPRTYTGNVPEEVVDNCKDTHTAADGSRIKAGGDTHDDRGLMAAACRHDIPLVVCNIDTPGERSKYVISLMIWLMLCLPDNATAAFLYDIACVTARTVSLVSHTHSRTPRTRSHTSAVWYFGPLARAPSCVLHGGDALLRARLAVSDPLRASVQTRSWVDRWGGRREVVVAPL